jgi:hypothetical protein
VYVRKVMIAVSTISVNKIVCDTDISKTDLDQVNERGVDWAALICRTSLLFVSCDFERDNPEAINRLIA